MEKVEARMIIEVGGELDIDHILDDIEFRHNWPDTGSKVSVSLLTDEEANLIAAAPEMYEALRHVTRVIERWNEGKEVSFGLGFEKAMQAIAKAEEK